MTKDNEILSSKNTDNEDINLDISLRPQEFSQFVGQTKTKKSLDILTRAAKIRKEPLDHIIIYGPPGLGKTTLAHIIAHSIGANIKITSGPAIERAGDLASILTNLADHDILFIDEIHRLPKTVEEVLYPALEDYALDIILGKGPGAKTLRLDLPHFTLIGATTQIGKISSPLRDRFGLIERLEYYTNDEISAIIKRSCSILNISAQQDGLDEIAKRSRKTPRIANRLIKRVRDYAQVKNISSINQKIAEEALEIHEIDHMGLDKIDRQMLLAIIENFSGGPVGLDTLAASIGEDIDTISDVYEPYLMQIGFIERTPRGRKATHQAYKHLGK